MGIKQNRCSNCRNAPCEWLKNQTSVVFVLDCPCFEEKGEKMPGYGKLSELQNLCRNHEKGWPEGMPSIRQELDIVRLCDLLQDSECPAWRWFPNNEEIKKVAQYLVSKGMTFREEE